MHGVVYLEAVYLEAEMLAKNASVSVGVMEG
jgi:hypothetical protein